VVNLAQDKVCQFVAAKAREIGCDQVWLFGSRARGDHALLADYDFAFEGQYTDGAWARFTLDVEENLPALREVDLVDLRFASSELRASVAREQP